MQKKSLKKISENLQYYLYTCFENAYLKHTEGICFESLKFVEKTEYRIKSYFKELKQCLEDKQLKDVFEAIKNEGFILEKKKQEMFITNTDFFFKSKYILSYTLLIEHYSILLRSIKNKIEKDIPINFSEIETKFIENFTKSVFSYFEIGNEMYPEINFREKPYNKYIKKKRRKTNILHEKFVFCMLYFLFFIFFLYIIFFSIRLYFLLSDFFFFVFPHKKLSEIDFYEKYNKNLQEINVKEKCELYLTDLYNFCFTDFYSVKGIVLCAFICGCILYYIFESKIYKSNKKKNYIRNFCLQKNLLEYHRILYSFFINFNLEKIVTKEQLVAVTEKRLLNIYNLYFILNKEPADQLLIIVLDYKKYVIYNLEKNKDKYMNFSYMLELKHCNLIIEVLENKKKGQNFDIDALIKKMLTNLDVNF